MGFLIERKILARITLMTAQRSLPGGKNSPQRGFQRDQHRPLGRTNPPAHSTSPPIITWHPRLPRVIIALIDLKFGDDDGWVPLYAVSAKPLPTTSCGRLGVRADTKASADGVLPHFNPTGVRVQACPVRPNLLLHRRSTARSRWALVKTMTHSATLSNLHPE